MERKNKSPVWRVFVKDAARKRTLCTQCGKEFKYRYTTTNLRDHLKRYHPEWLPDNGENSNAKEMKVVSHAVAGTNETQLVPHTAGTKELQLLPYPGTEEIKVLSQTVRKQSISVEIANPSAVNINSIPEECEPGRKNKSAVWQVFVKDAENKNVVCTICQKEFKFWNNTTNLHTHLKRTHPEWCPEPGSFNENGDEIECDDEQIEVESRHSSASSVCSFTGADPDSLPSNDSPVWRVFVKDDSNKGIFCALCQKHFSSLNNELSMIDHLRKLHPEWEPSSEESTGEDTKRHSSDSDVVVTKSVFVINNDRKNRSPVWDVFTKDAARKQSTCMLCKRVFKCYSNTANLLDHLRRLHPDWKIGSGTVEIKNEMSDHKRPTIARIRNTSETSDEKNMVSYIQTTPFPQNNMSVDVNSKLVDKLIGEMICMDFQNLNIVEDIGFKKLIKELVPTYNPPNRKTVVKEILPVLYENVSNELRQTLAKCKYVSVSVELWSNQNIETFLTLTVHYYSNEKYKSSVLHTERINTEHNSSRDLATVMHTILNDHWQIFQKITAIVTDDDAALRDACDMLNITHIPCVSQLLNTMITEELTQNDEAQQLLQRCLNLVAHFKLNPSANAILHNVQSQRGLPIMNLKQVAPTRWNSALHMAQRLNELKEPLLEALNSVPEVAELLSETDWSNLVDFIAVLNPFEWMASELSTDSYSNISKVVPLIRGVQTNLQNINCVSNFGMITRKSLLEKLEVRLSNYEKYTIPPVATLLDPRFKKAGLGVESAIEFSRNYVIEQLSEMKHVTSEEKRKTTERSSGNADIWNFLEKKLKESQKAPTTSAELSLKQYLDLPYLNRDECPFRFWIGQSNLEPELSDMAMKFMCIPATSFPAERIYSKHGVYMTDRRSRMTTKHFDMIIFLNKNL